MATLSILTGKCGGQREGRNQGFESRSHVYFCKDFFTCYLFKTSFRGENRNWSKAFESSMIRRRNGFCDPNITSGHLTYLSHFKPLTEKPKPVTLPFEKPLVDLEKKIIEVSCSVRELHDNWH